jgi:hypothetical protein
MKTVIQPAIPIRGSGLRPRRSPGPQAGSVDAQGVPGHVEGDAIRYLAVVSCTHTGRTVPPRGHFAVLGGALGVGVEVHLGALDGRPVREGGVCKVG